MVVLTIVSIVIGVWVTSTVLCNQTLWIVPNGIHSLLIVCVNATLVVKNIMSSQKSFLVYLPSGFFLG